MSENIEKIFNDDSKSKKRSANGAFFKVKGGRRGMVTASSYMTKKQQAEYAEIGEDKKYNIYEEITDFETFLKLPKDLRIKAYFNWLSRFPDEYIAQVWGVSSSEEMNEYLMQAEIPLNLFSITTNEAQKTVSGDNTITYEMDWINALFELTEVPPEINVSSIEINNDEWRVNDWGQTLEEEVRKDVPIGWNTYQIPIPICDSYSNDPSWEEELNIEAIEKRVDVEISGLISKVDLINGLEDLLRRVHLDEENVYRVDIKIHNE